MFERALQKSVELVLRGGTGLQVPLAEKYVARMRRRHPDRAPEDLVRGLESRYLLLVMASGTVAGLSAAVPGIGTLIGLGVSAADSVFFLEASAFYALSTGAVHGIESMSPRERRAVVVGVVVGESGAELLGKRAGESAKDWAAVVADRLPVVRSIDNTLAKRFIVQFIAKRGVLLFGKTLPAGLGAIIGAAGNRALAKSVITNVHNAFGPAPAQWADTRAVTPAE
ncbi:hypothetical protein [Nocardia blacklockiae]|uniref:hypothetical protein n=1 Tax=Nocardia blacklockiae TaxID=480036 RepID=UPI0018938BBB|nr:hypothetical protein [Nocardia blacklockiae]MBF6170348.1 hypothetical protein [Nocardia blacklockiae]